MPTNPSVLRLCRKTHLYFGLVIAPSLLFFAFTGAVQVLGLHEAAGSSYEPPAWLAELGQIHKKQTNILPLKRPQSVDSGLGKKESSANQFDGGRSPQSASPPANTGADNNGKSPAVAAPSTKPAREARPGSVSPSTLASKQKQHLPLKLFFLLVSVGLFTSTVTGIYMAYKYERGKVLVTVLLGLGLVTPILLLRF